MNKVTIVGCPGAGKTTFARALAESFNLPIYHLDYYYHQKAFDYGNNKQAWLDKIGELTAGAKWIIEGNYSSSYEQRIPKSDTLIFLDMPTWLSTLSVVKRRLKHRNNKRSEMPEEWKEKIDPEFFKYVILFRIKSRKNVIEGIKKYRHDGMEVLHFKTRKSAYKWLKSLTK